MALRGVGTQRILKILNISPRKIFGAERQDFECKQSKYEVAPQIPMRSMILSPSGGGKTVVLVSMIMDTKAVSTYFIIIIPLW